MQKVESTLLTMVIVHDEKTNKILLINRPEKLGFPGYLGPGGKIELTESFSEGAAREVREETGLQLKPEDLVYKGVDEFIIPEKNYRYIVFNYLTTTFEGQLLENPPEGELQWVPLDDIASIDMQPWFQRRLPLFFEEGTFEISFELPDFKSSPVKERIRQIG